MGKYGTERPRGNLLPKTRAADPPGECRTYKIDINHYDRTGEIRQLTEPEEFIPPEKEAEEMISVPMPPMAEFKAEHKKYSLTELAEKYNCGRSTICKWVSIYGLQGNKFQKENKEMESSAKWEAPAGLATELITEIPEQVEESKDIPNFDIIEKLKIINEEMQGTEEAEIPVSGGASVEQAVLRESEYDSMLKETQAIYNRRETQALHYRSEEKVLERLGFLGVRQNEPNPAHKEVSGKLQLTKVPRTIIRAIAEVQDYARREKYGEGADHWQEVGIQHWKDAAFRHWMDYLDDPQGVDKESGLSHLSHLACNLAYICKLEKKL